MGSKESGSAKTYDYFGTVAGLVSWGPIDGIRSIQVDGKEIFSAEPNGLPAAGDFTDLQPVDSKWLEANGYIRIYWGTSSATLVADPKLGPGHPPYRGIAYLVFHRFLFGRERSASPNIEAVVWRKPRPPAFLEPVQMNEGQVNPVPVMAEWLVSLMGLEQPEEIFDVPSWTAAADWVWTDPDRRARMAVSVLLVDSGDIRSRLGALLELTELALAWDEDGRLALRQLNLGEDPGGLPVLDARHTTSRTVLHAGGWRDVPTGLFVRYVDRERRWKEAGLKVDNILARGLRGEPDRQEVDLPWVTSGGQAAAVAARYLVRNGKPGCSLTLQVRSSAADSLLVGSKVLVDIEPEPGGEALAQAAIVTERREPREGPVALTLQADTLMEALPYIPDWIPSAESGLVALPIQRAVVIPLSPEGWALNAAVAVLAARPQADAIGFRVYAAPLSKPDEFTRLGDQVGFAVEVNLVEPVNVSNTEATLQLVAGPNGPDAYLAGRTPDDPGEAERDQLLCVLAQLDSAGRVVLSAEDGRPVVEFLSIVARSAYSADTWIYSVYRSRRGTTPLAWPVTVAGQVAGTHGWIFPLVNVVPWTHPKISGLLRDTEEGRIRMVTFTRYADDDSTPVPERGFFLPKAYDLAPFIVWTLPTTNPADTNTSGQIQIDLTATDYGGDLVRLSVVSRKGSDPVTVHLDETFPQTGSRRYQATLTFPVEGIYTLQVSARDSSGHEAIDLWQIMRIAGSGTGKATVTFSPPSGTYSGTVYVTVTAAPGYDTIGIRVTSPQSNPPATLVAQPSPWVVAISGNKYIWAVGARGGHVTDPVVFASYVQRDLAD